MSSAQMGRDPSLALTDIEHYRDEDNPRKKQAGRTSVVPVTLRKAEQPVKGAFDHPAAGFLKFRIGIVAFNRLVKQLEVAILPLLDLRRLRRSRGVALAQERQQLDGRHEHRLAVLLERKTF